MRRSLALVLALGCAAGPGSSPDPLPADPLLPRVEIGAAVRLSPTLSTWPSPTGDVPGTFVRIEPATFGMGALASDSCNRDENAPLHTVTLTHPFELADAEVTQADYREVTGESPSHSTLDCADCPVDSTDWHAAAHYTVLLSELAGLPACYACTGEGAHLRCVESTPPYSCAGYRLPTEAEHEHGFRAGTTTAVYNGDIAICSHRDPGLAEISWFLYSSDGHTHPVRSLAPNAFGLFDMSGNVWEWTADGYEELGQDAVDPYGHIGADDLRVMRGGSFNCVPSEVRAAHRSGLPSSIGGQNVGFRVARTLRDPA